MTLSVSQANEASAQTERRKIVVISDLHFGLGKTALNSWDPREDFRWSKALSGFLDFISNVGGGKVDLVIAGDLLEMWQPPDDVRCDGTDDATCSVSQVLRIVRHIVAQHKSDLKLLGEFAKRGDNRLIIIPGNHDAALMVPKIWKEVAKSLGAASGRVTLVKRGTWSSLDKQVVIEHGHQIGADVNSFSGWPTITTPKKGTQYLQSPWGERFVQKLFNAEERSYPIIDNLSPESYGARLRLSDRGLWHSIGDLARFIAFNLFETTIAQKVQSLGSDAKASESCSQQEAQAMGYRLFSSALPPGDPFKAQLEGNSEDARALQKRLDELTKVLSVEELAQICRQGGGTQELGALLESTFVPRQDVLRVHAQLRRKRFENMKMFVYAHTHQSEPAWDLQLALGDSVSILNTGAFQRLVGERGYRKRLTEMKIDEAADGLSKIPLEALAPCYSFVEVAAGNGLTKPTAETRLWKMAESEVSGMVVASDDPACQ